MPLICTIELPFGRYSATPWGRFVNEGAVEWPPSPWRVVRALVASWYTHHPEVPEEDVVESLGHLCDAPAYAIPEFANATTRHYMPDRTYKPLSSSKGTALALNPFVATAARARLAIVWADAQPPDGALAVLTQLASTVTYLGRAESRVVMNFDRGPVTPEGVLLEAVEEAPLDASTIDLLVPDAPLDLPSVTTTTAEMRRAGKLVPAHTRWATYVEPSPGTAGPAPPRRPSPSEVRVLQFAISGRRRPVMTDAALLTAQFRRAVTSLVQDDSALHGHAGPDSGVPRADQHSHAHFLAVNNLRGGRSVDRLVVWIPEGISPASASRVASIARLRIPEHLQKRFGREVRLSLEAASGVEALPSQFVGASREWRTLTPVTTIRHRKPRHSAERFADDTLRRELAYRGLPSGGDEVEVSLVPDAEVGQALSARRTYRARNLGRDRQHRGFHVRLRFAEPVEGPLVLGSLAHFGLGLFMAEPAGG